MDTVTQDIASTNPVLLTEQDFLDNAELINMNIYDPFVAKRSISLFPEKWIISNVHKIIKMPSRELCWFFKSEQFSTLAFLTICRSPQYYTKYGYKPLVRISQITDPDELVKTNPSLIKWNSDASLLTKDQIIKYQEYIDWYSINYHKQLDNEVIQKCTKHIDIRRLKWNIDEHKRDPSHVLKYNESVLKLFC